MQRVIFSADGAFSRFMNFLWDLILLSILWLVCSLPLVTLCASSTAAYYTAAKVLRHQNGTVISEFFRAFKLNFKQSAVCTLIYAAVFLFLIFDCAYFYGNPDENSLFFLYLFYLMILMTAANVIYLCPLLSRFSMENFRLFKTATVLMFRHLLSTILLLLLFAGALLGVWLMPWGVLLFPGLMTYLQTFLMEKVLRSCAPEPEEGSEEAQKWYYQ